MNKLDDALNRLATMSPAELREAWLQAYEMTAPMLSPALLRQGIAYRMQEVSIGGLSARSSRALARGTAPMPAVAPTPGTQLVRSWNGRTLSVAVTIDGYLFEDRTYRSLSAIAREVTGTAWSGPRFFGLREQAHG